ncbi:MAG: helix-turn-helix transcriptional regulator [Agathobacter sp.]|nr:helix-turn-helix transcriptional regulator [Agathobacter sp.]
MDKADHYTPEFEFVKKCLDYHRIAYHTYSLTEQAVHIEDLGIRHALGFTLQNLDNVKNLFLNSIHPNTLSYLTDELSCHYILMPLTDMELNKIFVVGPYITAEEKDNILAFMNQPNIAAPWLPILKNYYFQICSLTNGESIDALMITLADCVWGVGNYSKNYYENGLPENLTTISSPQDPQRRLDLFTNIELIETLYSGENELANAIAHGQISKARAIFSNLPLSGFKYEMEPLRNLKNFSIISNTIFRKAAEQGGVHPLYVDQLSTTFMTRIEEMTRSDNVFELWTEMLQRYCSLVNNHNTRSYSLPIQKVITRINFDITADLSLKTTAEYLKINASYLSNLFKKETGYTLTNYVNKKRMEHAAFLLSTTALSVSTIAQQCGILDDNYFTKLFKRQYQLTPSQYRETISHEVYKNEFSTEKRTL